MLQTKKAKISLREILLVLGTLGLFPIVSCNTSDTPPGITLGTVNDGAFEAQKVHFSTTETIP